jgi:type II secretory pathway pseudopilin PulG
MVVIIIAILASIAVPQYLRVSERARGSEALQVLAALRSSEMRYKAFEPAGTYANTAAQINTLDVEIPGYQTAPASQYWTYTVTGTGAGSNGKATRVGFAAKSIEIDLDNGATCAPGNGGIYGLNNAAC